MKIYTENIAKYSKVKRQVQTEHGQNKNGKYASKEEFIN